MREEDEEMFNCSKLGLSGLPKGFLDQEIHYPIVTIWFLRRYRTKRGEGLQSRISRYQLCYVVHCESNSYCINGLQRRIIYSHYLRPSHASMRLSLRSMEDRWSSTAVGGCDRGLFM